MGCEALRTMLGRQGPTSSPPLLFWYLVLDDRVHAKWTSKNHAALLKLSFLLNYAQSEAFQRETSSVCAGEHGSRGCTAVLHMF